MNSSLIDCSGTPLGICFLVLAQIVQFILIRTCLFFLYFVYTVKSNGIKFGRRSKELSLDGGINFLFPFRDKQSNATNFVIFM